MHLTNLLIDLLGVSFTDAQYIQSKFKSLNLSKNEFLVNKGERCYHLCFIESGFIRVFSETADKEVTQWIGGDNSFVTDLSSFLFGTKARWNIQALTDVRLWSLSVADYQILQNGFTNWNKVEKYFLASCFVMLEDRIFNFIALSAEARYRQLFETNPTLFNQVPLQYIASMLGMTAETLSRIRAR